MNKVAWTVVALVLLAALIVALPALSQPGGGPGGPAGPPGGPGGPGMGGPMGPPLAPAMVVNEKGVYVMMGPQVFRLDPETLKVLARSELPRPEPPNRPEAPQQQ